MHLCKFVLRLCTRISIPAWQKDFINDFLLSPTLLRWENHEEEQNKSLRLPHTQSIAHDTNSMHLILFNSIQFNSIPRFSSFFAYFFPLTFAKDFIVIYIQQLRAHWIVDFSEKCYFVRLHLIAKALVTLKCCQMKSALSFSPLPCPALIRSSLLFAKGYSQLFSSSHANSLFAFSIQFENDASKPKKSNVSQMKMAYQSSSSRIYAILSTWYHSSCFEYSMHLF